MALTTRCLDCGCRTKGSRCATCKQQRRAPSGWHWQAIRDQIKARDGHACRLCGRPDRLEVHHADGNPANNQHANLITLCHDCHLDTRKLPH